MDGSSSKETNVLSSNNPAGTQSTSFSHPQPPPPYEQPHTYPNNSGPYPQPNPGAGVVYQPGVAVTQQPGVTVMQHGPMGPVTTTVVGNTVVQTRVIEPTIGSLPTIVTCRSCNQPMMTRVEHMPSGRTHIAALLLCLIGCWPLVCLPYCIGSCQSAQHYCTNCGAYVGTH